MASNGASNPASNDVVERLRSYSIGIVPLELLEEAAAEIIRLREEIAHAEYAANVAERRYCFHCWFFGTALNCIDCRVGRTHAEWRVRHPLSAEVLEENGLVGKPRDVPCP